MKVKAYTIFDTKALTYSAPFYASTDGAATRIVKDAVSDPNTTLGRHPADYILYCVGSWDDTAGTFDPAAIRDHIIDLVALVPVPAPTPLFEPELEISRAKNGAL